MDWSLDTLNLWIHLLGTAFCFGGPVFVVFYFLLIRPQTQRQKKHREMVSGLQVGDEVITAGGILGTITRIKDDFVKLKVSDGVEITVQKSTISALQVKGTVEST